MALRSCLCIILTCLLTGHSASATPLFDTPHEVVLTQRNARVRVMGQVPVTLHNGVPVCVFYVPDDATEIAFSPTPTLETLTAWRVERVALPHATDNSALYQRRAHLMERIDALRGQLHTTQALLTLWTTPPAESLSLTMFKTRTQLVRERVPEATATLAQQKRDLEALEKELAALPETPKTVQRIVLRLRPDHAGQTLSLNYAYTLSRCGWQPMYTIHATGDSLHIRMDADITQYSGIDWKNTRLTLISGAVAPLTPQPLQPWLIYTDKNRPAPAVRARRIEADAVMPPMSMSLAPDPAPAYTESAATAGWTLENTTLPEGVNRLTILRDVWNDPLQRLARPTQGNAPVWIRARHIFTGTPLPAGQAHYFLEDTALGQGDFTPKGDTVELFFGVDPLVSVQTAKDTRLTGTSGVVNKVQTVSWGWLYTVTNQRSTPVTVRLEDAAPQATDTAMTCTIHSEPPAQRGEHHSIYWDISVPARGNAQTRYAVSITAPHDIQLYPGR